MRKIITYGAIALLATLAACSHGSNSALPGQQPRSGNTDAIRQKMLVETQRAASTFVAPKHPGYLPEGAQTFATASGIQEEGQAPVPGGMFNIVNQYNTTVNGQHVTVYAGSLRETGSGIVLVVTRSADLHTARAQTYTVASGAVRIAGVTGGQLQLQTVGTAHQSIPFRMPL